MKHNTLYAGIASVLLLSASCASHYEVTGVQRSRILIDQRYDAVGDAEATAFLAPYKQKVDSLMSPVVGQSAHYMKAERPESDLSNLLADILVWGGKFYDEKPDFAVYNMGGIRAALPAGKVTYGDILDIAPFENKICFLTLTGEKVEELFRQMASVGGEGVSKEVYLQISKKGRLISATLRGKAIKPDALYRVATIDYLAQGNDKMEAFKDKQNVKAPTDANSNARDIIVNYFKEMAAQGKVVDGKVSARIEVCDDGEMAVGVASQPSASSATK